MQYFDAKQRLVAAKAIGQPCTCKRKCFDKIGEEGIKLIFEGFLKLEKDKQDAYLFALLPLLHDIVHERMNGSGNSHTTIESKHLSVT